MARVTIEDVAERSGVSVATVSRAIRGLPNVSPATRERVMAAVAELRYRADPNASRLATGRTATIGLGVTAIPIWYTGQVISGVEAVLAAEGYDLSLFLIADEEVRHRILGDPSDLSKRVDGLILLDLLPEPCEQSALIENRLPWVMVGAECSIAPSIFIDNVQGARRATEHLVELGHTRIGLISGGPASFPTSAPSDRKRGFLAALHGHGLDLNPLHEQTGNFSAVGGYEAMEAMFTLDELPSAIFAMSDEMAMGAMRAIADRGMSVPGDISVVGFDDHDLAFAIGLSTVRQDAVALGARGARALLSLLSNPAENLGKELVSTRLIIRESTAAREK